MFTNLPYCWQGRKKRVGGGILADHLTKVQPGEGVDYAHHITKYLPIPPDFQTFLRLTLLHDHCMHQ